MNYSLQSVIVIFLNDMFSHRITDFCSKADVIALNILTLQRFYVTTRGGGGRPKIDGLTQPREVDPNLRSTQMVGAKKRSTHKHL